MGIRGLIGAPFGALLLAILAAGPAAAAGADGTWLAQSGDTKIHVTNCGANLCGTVVWQKSPGTDRRNPDPAKRDRQVVGIQMVYGMAPSGPNRWSGQIYNPRDGKTSAGTMTLEGDTLKLSGCGAGSLFCKAETWTRSN